MEDIRTNGYHSHKMKTLQKPPKESRFIQTWVSHQSSVSCKHDARNETTNKVKSALWFFQAITTHTSHYTSITIFYTIKTFIKDLNFPQTNQQNFNTSTTHQDFVFEKYFSARTSSIFPIFVCFCF